MNLLNGKKWRDVSWKKGELYWNFILMAIIFFIFILCRGIHNRFIHKFVPAVRRLLQFVTSLTIQMRRIWNSFLAVSFLFKSWAINYSIWDRIRKYLYVSLIMPILSEWNQIACYLVHYSCLSLLEAFLNKDLKLSKHK